MKPIDFKESNVKLILAGCGDLPAFRDGVHVISCWKMSFKERIRALFSGKVWMGIRHESTQPPAWLNVERTAFKKEKKLRRKKKKKIAYNDPNILGRGTVINGNRISTGSLDREEKNARQKASS